MSIAKGEDSYKSEFRNGIKSYPKKHAALSVTFAKSEGKKDISERISSGMKVDIFDPAQNQWLEGTVSNVERIDSDRAKLKVSVENKPT